MQHCRTSYSKALLLSVIAHIAVVGSAIAFASYGGTPASRDFRTIVVSLLGNDGPVRPGHAARVSEPDATKQELKKDPPAEAGMLPGETLPETAPSERGNGETGAGPQSPTPGGAGDGKKGEISSEQWQLVSTALEKAKTYPRLARERGVEGVVLVRFKVLPTGEIEKVDIVKSSGSDLLDTASVRTVYRAAPMPYVNGWVEVPISYVLK